MASIVETKSVSIRKGNHNENMAFTGVLGEVTADLGYTDKSGNLGTDSNATLRLHNGVTKGGVPMARADMLNVSTELLAQGRELINDKNLAYSDLSNVVLPESTSVRNEIKSIMETCGLADESSVVNRLETKADVDTGNINTANLTSSSVHDGAKEGDYPLAYASTKNINTLDLATTQYHNNSANGNLPLSYANMSNVDTTNITKSTSERTSENLGISGPVIAKADFSNTNTTNLTLSSQDRPSTMSGPMLARADLTNVDPSAFSVDTFGLEKTANKKGVINSSDTNQDDYPNIPAVISYVKNKIDGVTNDYANTSLTNVDNWDILYTPSTSPIYVRSANLIQSQGGFVAGKVYATGIYLVNDPLNFVSVQADVDTSGKIVSLRMEENVGTIDLTDKNPFSIESSSNSTAVFTISSTSNEDGTYTYGISSITQAGSNFIQDETYVVKSNVTNEYYKAICTQLEMIVSGVDVNGQIQFISCDPRYGVSYVNQDVVTITSETNETATLSISSEVYNEDGGAGLAKVDLTNLLGMTGTDQILEKNAPWRIRHDESIPSISQATISSEQDYTIATNGNVWRALKQLNNVPSVIFKAQFVQNNDHTTEPSITLFNTIDDGLTVAAYEQNATNKYKNYTLFPNHSYAIQIADSNQTNTYPFTTGNIGTSKTLEYSLANITFNINVQTATLKIESQGMTTMTYNITSGTHTAMITNDSTWTVSSSGYTDKTGSLTVASGDQTVSVTLEQS